MQVTLPSYRVHRNQEHRCTYLTAISPWFIAWGRNTMIALPGLTMATARYDDAASILRTFAEHTSSEGMLPNRFPDSGEVPEYNTVDATLWYFHAVAEYLEASAWDSQRDLRRRPPARAARMFCASVGCWGDTTRMAHAGTGTSQISPSCTTALSSVW